MHQIIVGQKVACNNLIEIKIARNSNGSKWYKVLFWKDFDGRFHAWAFPLSSFVTKKKQVIKFLLDRGLDIIDQNKLIKHIIETPVKNVDFVFKMLTAGQETKNGFVKLTFPNLPEHEQE